ncbi:MAG: hypothetical protein DYG89_37285 [Caldilinea sp. CFX5]|nr:hypothetical protein [Caldilinea sp. CFX5]
MEQVQQIESVTQIVSVEQQDQIAKEVSTLRLLAEARRIAARNDAEQSWVSSTEMRKRMAKHGVMVG